MKGLRFALVALVPLLLQAGARFDPVKEVPISVSEGVITLTVPKGVHLKTRQFRVALVSHGFLRLGTLPPATGQDEAGDPIWRGTVSVGLKGSGLADPVQLVITYQPCTEGPDGMCFLPVRRTLLLPVAEIPIQAP
jgi:thioredoxin:protein disulfide reductase